MRRISKCSSWTLLKEYWASKQSLGERWPSRLVATAAEGRLNFPGKCLGQPEIVEQLGCVLIDHPAISGLRAFCGSPSGSLLMWSWACFWRSSCSRSGIGFSAKRISRLVPDGAVCSPSEWLTLENGWGLSDASNLSAHHCARCDARQSIDDERATSRCEAYPGVSGHGNWQRRREQLLPADKHRDNSGLPEKGSPWLEPRQWARPHH